MITNKRQIILRFIFTLTTVLVISFIFFQSLKNAQQSATSSGRILAFLNWITGAIGLGAPFAHDFVRTCAHFAEFMLLGISLCSMFYAYNTKHKLNFLLSVLSFSLVAVSDECIQLFSDGRAFQFADIYVDITGAVCGFGFALLFITFIRRIRKV